MRIRVGIIVIILLLLTSVPVYAGELVVEYSSDFTLLNALYSAKLTIADFDGDGRDDIVISDDYGSFHIFALHNGAFEELWVSDPLGEESGTIKWLGMLEQAKRKSKIFVLDSNNELSLYGYDGYVLKENKLWHVPLDGYLVDAAVINGSLPNEHEFLQLVLLPEGQFVLNTFHLDGEVTPAKPGVGIVTPLAGMPRIAADIPGFGAALLTVKKTSPEGAKTPHYNIEIATPDGEVLTTIATDGYNYLEEAFAVVTLDSQGGIIALSYSNSDSFGHLKMRIWHEKDGVLKPGSWKEIYAHRAIGAGDIDGDGHIEFVMVGIDSLVRILDEDSLTYKKDGNAVHPTRPSIVDSGEVFQDSSLFSALGIKVTESDGVLSFKSNGKTVEFKQDASGWMPAGGDSSVLDVRYDPYGIEYYPLSRICIALGYAFRYRSDQGLVEVYS